MQNNTLLLILFHWLCLFSLSSHAMGAGAAGAGASVTGD